MPYKHLFNKAILLTYLKDTDRSSLDDNEPLKFEYISEEDESTDFEDELSTIPKSITNTLIQPNYVQEIEDLVVTTDIVDKQSKSESRIL